MKHTPLTAASLREHLLPLPQAGSKDARGRALVVAGSASVPGAALLAAVAALRAGAGRLRIATVASAAAGMGLMVPEAMVVGLPETADGAVDVAQAATSLRTLADGCDAVLIGPGMLGEAPTAALAVELLGADASFILDATALSELRARAGPSGPAPGGRWSRPMPARWRGSWTAAARRWRRIRSRRRARQPSFWDRSW